MRETRLDSVIALRSGGLPAPLAAWVVARVAELIATRPRIVSAAEVRVREDGEVRLVRDLSAPPFSSRAPEVVMGADGDLRASVFALGVLLVELALGRSPFERATDLETRLAVSEETVPQLAGRAARASNALDQLVARATAKAPSERFSSALELRDVIDAYLADEMHEVGTTQLASTVFDAIEQAPSHDRTSMPDYQDAKLDLKPEAPRSIPPDQPRFDQSFEQEVAFEQESAPRGAPSRPKSVAPKRPGPELELEVDNDAILAERQRAARTRAPLSTPPKPGMSWMVRLGLALAALLAASIAYQFLLRPIIFD